MRILCVGNGAYKARGAMCHDINRKICNGFIRASTDNNVYFLSDRDTARAGNFLRSSSLGVGHCNNVFIDVCHNFQPDLIMFSHADIIKNDSIKKVKEFSPKTKMVQINIDPLFSQHNINNLRVKMPLMDATFVTTAGKALGSIGDTPGVVSYMPNAVDASMESPRCHERSDQEHDVFWACRLSKTDEKEGNLRIEFPLHLEESGKVKIDYRGMNGKAPVFGTSYFNAISNAKMGLNINQSGLIRHFDTSSTAESVYLYSSDRIAHYMGSGLMLLCHRDKERDSKLEELFAEDKEIVFFTTKEELLEKALYYKEHDDERKEIARRGWEKSHQYLNGMLLAKYIVEVAFKQPFSEDYIWPTDLY